ncbi:MAG: phosphatidylcholine/phosphatidylserine synthase [Alphaproteobacteria bacterium]|nr:phosphatidylcholine/phosphatidylserine synthase [Alphaproteobacteria bacterium]
MKKQIKNKVKKSLAAVPDLKEVDIRPMFPNMVTMAALACGLTSLQFAFWGYWASAVVCIAMAGFFDGMDGRVARMFNVSSKFGAELDSLSDLVSFGVAPGFLLYRWTMDQGAVVFGDKNFTAVGVPWVFALFLAVYCALRLARFNTMLDTKQPPYWTHFFTGLPAPGGAYVAMFPLIFYLWTGAEFLSNPVLVGFFMVFSAVLMASRIPTPCFKKLHFSKLNRDGRVFLLAFVGVLVWLSIRNFWAVVSIFGIIYLIMLPLGIMYFMREKKRFLGEE